MAKRLSPLRERCAAAGGTGSASPHRPPPPPPHHQHRAGEEGGPARGVRPGPLPPSLALARPGPGQRLEPDGSRPGHAHCGLPPGEGEAWSWCEFTSGEPSPLCTAVPSASWEQGKACLGVSRVLLHKQVYDKARRSLLTSVGTVSCGLTSCPSPPGSF
ncbi:protein atonal homolog 8-like [Zalophus californianus]|uniref:Protein atonal homolog 8-like n=1 Tax=Zalophus californianus TaxID=9704 RepID=A0A6J2BEE1_ZALCA|nr:protein atonal homolog 8-like [Zalophus californianus]